MNRLREVTWDNPNKMHIETGHATFDRQTNCISTGNVIANTQSSSYIRPYCETECNGYTTAPGHLRNFDLGHFSNLPANVRRAVEEATATESAILYEFRHFRGPKWNREKVVDGYILTRGHNEHYRLLRIIPTRYTEKTLRLLDECATYISTRTESEAA